MVDTLGLDLGSTHTLDVSHAERDTVDSNLRIDAKIRSIRSDAPSSRDRARTAPMSGVVDPSPL